MQQSLHGMKVAILVANGFNEPAFLGMQKAMRDAGAVVTMISADQSLVNGWRDTDWGLSFPADAMLSSSLAADYDMLCVPGGRRSVDKMQLTAHTKRFVGGFVNAGKPVAMMNEANDLISFCELGADYQAAQAGAVQSGALFSMEVMPADMMAMIEGDMIAFFMSCMDVAKAA